LCTNGVPERRDIRTDEEAGIGKNQLTRADSRDEAYVEQNSKRQKETCFYRLLHPEGRRRQNDLYGPDGSYLHYVCGYNVLLWIATPQFSINEMRKRDAKGLETNSSYRNWRSLNSPRLQKPTKHSLYDLGPKHRRRTGLSGTQ
ncbi:hypothetical protein ACS6XI_08315, partial [Porphyromonas endodontalis]